MGRMISRRRNCILFLCAALLAISARAADTIVLKNGRRIAALSVVEEGDKVKYLTSAGELSLPKSIVDHIEKGGGAPLAETAGTAAANLAIAPPAMQPGDWGGSEEIEHAAVHDGSIDRVYIAKLEQEARSGTQRAGFSAAIAHHAAAWFELSRGDMGHALADARTAANYAPEEPLMLLNVAYLHLRRSEFKESLDYLDRARRFAPDNADVAKLAGWAYYGLNKLDQAVAEWKRAPALARDVLRTLEKHFSAIESELNYTPPDPIGVILYTQDAFTDITKAPAWAGALNDGRIRVPVQGLTAVDQELSRVLKHELTHSFITQKTRSACMAGRKCKCSGADLPRRTGHSAGTAGRFVDKDERKHCALFVCLVAGKRRIHRAGGRHGRCGTNPRSHRGGNGHRRGAARSAAQRLRRPDEI